MLVKRSGPTVNCETRDLIYRDYTDDKGVRDDRASMGGAASSTTSARVARAKHARKVRANDNSGSDRGTRRRIAIPAVKVTSPLVRQAMINAAQKQPAASKSMAAVNESHAVSATRHVPQEVVR